ncbi:MAG: class I SAM-dependent methyltransferase [Reyranella sp.]|uniref:class I SAM-dependent methyltransferase n=1 Tax=Reyranella sp. TaxID=1929291 RepID=UPI003D09FF0B
MADGSMPAGYAGRVDVGCVRGSQGLQRLIDDPGIRDVLDIGSGAGEHARIMRAAGLRVFSVDLAPPADHVGDFMSWHSDQIGFDAVWLCHVLEHQPSPGGFLAKVRSHLRPGGLLFVTVPPLKHEIVGGHVTLWNAGLLLYQLILAGFDCRRARVGTYASGPDFPPYNITAIVQRPVAPLDLPPLKMDRGDIETLAPFFPVPVAHGFDGRLPDIDW